MTPPETLRLCECCENPTAEPVMDSEGMDFCGRCAVELIEADRDRVASLLREAITALEFYADAKHYDDWHDTGRTEKATTAVPTERWEKGPDGRYEYAGFDYEEREFDQPVWLTTAAEDSGARAREALARLHREGGTQANLNSEAPNSSLGPES